MVQICYKISTFVKPTFCTWTAGDSVAIAALFSCLLFPTGVLDLHCKCLHKKFLTLVLRSRSVFDRSRSVFDRSRSVLDRSRSVFDLLRISFSPAPAPAQAPIKSRLSTIKKIFLFICF